MMGFRVRPTKCGDPEPRGRQTGKQNGRTEHEAKYQKGFLRSHKILWQGTLWQNVQTQLCLAVFFCLFSLCVLSHLSKWQFSLATAATKEP